MALDAFSPHTRAWFEGAFAAPTAAQTQAWPAIASGEHVLISAPTGSGKTLAAFLYAIDQLANDPLRAAGPQAADDQPGLRLAAEGALLRHRSQPAHAAARDRCRPRGRRAHRGHSPARAPADASRGARHPHHHARVAVPDADRTRPADLLRSALGDHRRDPRRRRHQARRPPRPHPRAPRTGRRRRGSAHRTERHPEPARGGGALHGRPAPHMPDRRHRCP